MITLTLREITEACGGTYFGPPALLEQAVTAITTDSRALRPSCLFAAIRGERSDGHDFMPAAVAGGALCCLGQRRDPEGLVPVIVVEDTGRALMDIAALLRGRTQAHIVGVTGSAGKTTAKEMIACVLARRFQVLKTQGNLNNELGVPMTVFRLEPEHQAAVIEMGISHFGEMRRLTRVVRPDLAVFTVIGHSHLEFLENREGVLKAKSELLEGMSSEGVVIVNGDDDLLRAMTCAQKKLAYGMSADCDVRARDIRFEGLGSIRCVIEYGERCFEAAIPAFGDHMVYAALAAAAVGFVLGLTDDEIAAGIGDYQTVGGRSHLIRTEKLTVIDDSYNANPTSTASALSSLSRLPGRRVAILGDMRELGGDALTLHRQVGAAAGQADIDLLAVFGELALEIAVEASRVNPELEVRAFDSREALSDALPGMIHEGDFVLVKASRSMRFEEFVNRILEI